jgi:non-heme chloroperoxidase
MLQRSITITAVLTAAFITTAPDSPRAETPYSPPSSGVQLRRIRLGTGIELQVAESGPANGEPVLFLHGFPDSWYSYTGVLTRLPANIRAIVPTQRGHGESDKPACCYRVEDFAADAVALLDALGIERAHIVGHSMGSIIAQRVASKWPARVNRLVLVGSTTTVRTPPLLEFMPVVRKLTDPIPAGFAREFQLGTVFKTLPAAFLDTLVLESEKLPARVWRDVLGGLVAPDAMSRHEWIAAPTLIVWGEKDALFARSYQDALVRAIKGARLLVYSNIGHGPFWEDPDRFTKDLMKFLN